MGIEKGSRYENVTLFEGADDARTPFRGIGPRPLPTRRAAMDHLVAQRERLDALGYTYYGEPRRWYLLAEANAGPLFPEDALQTPSSAGLSGDHNKSVGTRIAVPASGQEP